MKVFLLLPFLLISVNSNAFEIFYLDPLGKQASLTGDTNLSFKDAGIQSDWTCELFRNKNTNDSNGKLVGRAGVSCHVRNEKPRFFAKLKCSDNPTKGEPQQVSLALSNAKTPDEPSAHVMLWCEAGKKDKK